MSSLLLLYGSETGTAQDTAESLRREAILQSIEVRLMGLDEYNVDELPSERVVVLVVSTTGQGELPPNMRFAWRRLLRKALPKDWLADVRIGVLGLGDSSYQKYNFAGKKLYRRLCQLGAKPVVDLGLADDQHELGIDGALGPWKASLWSNLYEIGIFEKMTPDFDRSSSLPPKYVLDYACSSENIPAETIEYVTVHVLANQRVTAESHFQDTRLVDFAVPDSTADQLSYNPGDVLMVRPENLPESVAIAIEAFGYDDELLDRPFSIRSNDKYMKSPPRWLLGDNTTLRICLTRLFDLQVIPKKSFFEILGSLSSDELEKEKLMELASPEGLDDLLDYSVRCRRTVAETLRDFPRSTRRLPVERLFDLFPLIRPRAFSIASSMEAQPGRIQLLVAKVQYKSRMSEPRRGLCSSFIAGLHPGDKVFVRIRAGTFSFPSPVFPALCVGPGTGVAPFRSYLGWRHTQPSPSKSLLFFGCRGRERDFYFSSEWPTITTSDVITAFSRDGEHKSYVQHLIKEHAETVWKVLLDEGFVFVAGSAGDMPLEVAAAIDEVASDRGFDEGSFTQFLETKGRIQYETWS